MNTENATFDKNEHYGKLNERFSIREKELLTLGFEYRVLPLYDIAVFIRERYSKAHTLASALVLCADEEVWQDYLDRAKRFCA